MPGCPSSLSLRKAGSNSDVLFWRFDDDWPGAITVSVLDNAISATQIRAGRSRATTLMLTLSMKVSPMKASPELSVFLQAQGIPERAFHLPQGD